MTEAILIEIAQRFRHLEDIAAVLGTRHRHESVRVGREDEAFKMTCQVYGALEACREDMVAMQELIRKATR